MGDLKEAVATLVDALKTDKDYRITWEANIAMAYQDEAARQETRDSRAKLRDISNKAAKNFINTLMRLE